MHANITGQAASLDAVLAYRHPGVIRRYCKEHDASQQEAEEIFIQTLEWLYLCYRAGASGPDAFDCAMTPELEKLDWMWHTFLLFTRDYAAFCFHYFGTFIHHVPQEDEGEAVEEEDLRLALSRQFGLIYDLLGEETLTAWYDQCLYAAPNEPSRPQGTSRR